VLVIADMNPDYAGTQRMNPAFRNRFGIQLEWDYDDLVEAQLIESRNLLLMARQIRTDAASAMTTPVSTNMLMEFEDIVRSTGNLAFAKLNFRTHIGNIENDYQTFGWVG
jgi:MoxR-like ATPase